MVSIPLFFLRGEQVFNLFFEFVCVAHPLKKRGPLKP